MMNKKRFFSVLILILVILLAISIFGTFFMDSGNSYDLGHDDVSIAVTGDVMFGRKMPAVLDSGESPFRHVENVTKNADILL